MCACMLKGLSQKSIKINILSRTYAHIACVPRSFSSRDKSIVSDGTTNRIHFLNDEITTSVNYHVKITSEKRDGIIINYLLSRLFAFLP